MDPLHRLHVIVLAAIHRAGDDGESFLASDLRRLNARSVTSRVHAHRFLDERVLTGTDDLRQVLRPEAGRRSEDDHVHIRVVNYLLVGVKPFEDGVVINFDCVGNILDVAQALSCIAALLAEDVAHRNEVNVVTAAHGVRARARAAPAGADDAHANGIHVPARRAPARRRSKNPRRRDGRSSAGAGLDEITTGGVLIHATGLRWQVDGTIIQHVADPHVGRVKRQPTPLVGVGRETDSQKLMRAL